ncbi:MAG: glycoside hydrolase family 20 zincin-like fold domain-containing protein [Melioribacteraceae bacterium]|nr:glycoside hydrolase family 20 zincin-like fold domain-containing protein [Melioribacteraceae bacterium]
MVKENFITNTIIFLAITFLYVNNLAQQELLTVVPQPKEYQLLSGNIQLSENQFTLKKYFDDNEPVVVALNDAASIFSVIYDKELFVPAGKSELLIGIPSKNKNFRKICEPIKLVPTKDIGEEGYLMLVENNKIVISANSNKGLFYGLQTLKQFIKGSIQTKSIPNVIIKDYPSFKFRGVMDDISRGPIPTLDFMKSQIRRLAELKVNALTHYVEHVVKTKKHPGIAPDDGSLTIEEWKEISEYAKKYFVTVVGSFQSFGHFQNILSNPDYAHLGESGSLISPVKPESYLFLKDIYDEMIPAFDAPFFNVNCDETFDLGKAESKHLVDSIGYDGAYLQHIMKLYKIVKSHGIRMSIWGDILLEYPNLISKIPKDVIIGTWTYDDHESFQRYIKPFKEAGLEFFVAPGVLNSNKIFPNYNTTFGNIKRFAKEGKDGGAFGVLNCIWDDGGTALFTNDWFGVAYGADKSWNHSSDDSNFDTRFNQSVYAAINNSYTKTIWKLNQLAPLESTDGMTDKILFSKLIPEAGRKTKISLVDWDNVLTIINEAEKELINAQFNFYKSDRDYLQFVIDLYRVLANERFLLLQTADIYSDVIEFNLSDPVKSRELILTAINNSEKLIRHISVIKSEFEKLWLMENHTYALNIVSDEYQMKIDDYKDMKGKLFLSLKNLDSSKPVPTSAEVRLAITKLPGKYFREWMMVNPMPNKDGQKTSGVDYLYEMGGELIAQPKVAEEFFFESAKYRWRRVVSENPDIVNLAEIFPDNNQNVVVYAFANISVDEESIVDALVGCDDGIEVIINGKSVYKNIGQIYQPENEYLFQLPLKKGRNNLMLKISQTDSGWYFTFRLPNSEVRNSKNRYRIISGMQR